MHGSESTVYAIRNVTDDVIWIGADDRSVPIFEGMFPIPNGVSYNSYVIRDEKTIIMDTCDSSVATQYWENLMVALDGRSPDYFFVGHMEPDHGAQIKRIVDTFPDVIVVASPRAIEMMGDFYGLVPKNTMPITEGDTLSLGKHTLTFVSAMMVHWPEVMFAYDSYDGTLYCEDAFGSFGASDGQLFADRETFDRKYLDDARRYYANIVGKYGKHVQKVLAKAGGIRIERLCPLHGQVWDKDIDYIVDKYQHWSTYEPEVKGVVIAYASMYGNTEAVANLLALLLDKRGVKDISVINLMSTHPSYLVADAFKYSNIVLAAPTYNNGLQPMMRTAIEDMASMAVQRRGYSLIANGSWSAASEKVMKSMLSDMESMVQVGETFIIRSSMKPEQVGDLEVLADAIVASL